MVQKKKPSAARLIGLLGVGLDGTDGQKRLTRNEDILLIGGSQETHERMQEVSIRVNESLHRRGKRLRDAEPQEVLDLLRDALARVGDGQQLPES
jgi:hypothetical protein